MVVVRLPPSKMRAESKGVRAGSEAMHSDTRARKQATSTVPLSSVQPCQAEKGKSTSRSQSAVRHVYKSNYEIKDVRAAWKAMNSHTMVRKQSTSALEHVQVYRAQTGKSPSRGVVQERLRGKVAVLHGSKATVIAACARRMAARKYVKQLREFLHAAIAKQGEHVRSARASEPERQFSMSMSTEHHEHDEHADRLVHKMPSGVIRGHQRPSEAIRGHQRPPGAIRGHQRPSEAIRGHQGPSEAIRGHQRPSEAIGPQFSMSMSTNIIVSWSTHLCLAYPYGSLSGNFHNPTGTQVPDSRNPQRCNPCTHSDLFDGDHAKSVNDRAVHCERDIAHCRTGIVAAVPCGFVVPEVHCGFVAQLGGVRQDLAMAVLAPCKHVVWRGTHKQLGLRWLREVQDRLLRVGATRKGGDARKRSRLALCTPDDLARARCCGGRMFMMYKKYCTVFPPH
jgi:hypothetical protein